MIVDNFDDIRPYQDAEVAGVIERLIQDPDMVGSVAAFLVPRWYRLRGCSPVNYFVDARRD